MPSTWCNLALSKVMKSKVCQPEKKIQGICFVPKKKRWIKIDHQIWHREISAKSRLHKDLTFSEILVTVNFRVFLSHEHVPKKKENK